MKCTVSVDGYTVYIFINRLGGVNIKVMKGILSHADAETTMDIYAEATKDLKRSEMINFEEYFNNQKVIQSGIS